MNKTIIRSVNIVRNTNETQIALALNLDGTGQYQIETPVGFFNHMLELFAKHGLFDLTIKATGDMNYDDHHTIEDTGIVLGQAIAKAVGDKRGVKRYGSLLLPMDEVLCAAAVDLAGRFAFETNYAPVREQVNDFPTEMMWHFFQQVAINAQINLHLQLLNPGKNEHHRLEAIFKGFARALREACEQDPRAANAIPSTKGTLSSEKKS